MKRAPAARDESAQNFGRRLKLSDGSELGTGHLPLVQNDPEILWSSLLKTILVPTDFSSASNRAIEYAVGLANQYNARLTLLHVIDVSEQTSSGTAHEMMSQLWSEGSTRLGQLSWSLSNRIVTHTLLEEGLPWEVIVELSRNFDLVVLGRDQSKRGLHLFSQHIRQRVVAHSGCPVMVVPAPA